mgnify:CR=1 FL=1
MQEFQIHNLGLCFWKYKSTKKIELSKHYAKFYLLMMWLNGLGEMKSTKGYYKKNPTKMWDLFLVMLVP